MKLDLLVLAFGVGVFLAVHLAMNAQVGQTVGNPRMGNAAFWLIGAVMAVVIALSGWDSQFFTRAREVPAWLWVAGAVGACLVFAIAALIPRLGAATTNVLLLAGQLLGGLLIAHFGLLSSPVQPLNSARLVGAVIMILGASIAVVGRLPFVR